MPELRILEACGEKDRDRKFIRMWTMKESYVKWLGCGLGYDVQNVDTTEGTGFAVMEDEELIVCGYGINSYVNRAADMVRLSGLQNISRSLRPSQTQSAF